MSKIDDLALKNAKKMQEDALKAYEKAKNNAKTNKNTQTTKQPIPQSTKTKKSIPVSNAKNKRTPSHGRHQVDADVREALNKEVKTNPIPQALTRFNEKIINNVVLSPITTPYQIATGKKLIDFGLNPETKSAEVGAGVGNFLGTAVEYGMGYKAAGKAIEKGAEKLLTSAPGKKAAAKVVGSILGKKAGKEVAENVVKGVAKNIVGDATVGTVLNLADARGRGLEGKELAEDMAINAAFDFGVGNAVEFAPMAFKALKNAKLAKQAKNINLDTLSQNAKKVAETGDLGAQNGINTVKQTAGENLPFDSVKQEIPYRTVTPEAFEKITKAVESRSGCKVTFADLPDGVDGQYKNGVITISTKAKNPTYTVLKHELTHHIETSGHYKALSDFIENTMREAGYDVEGAINQIKADYAKKKVFLEDGDAKKEFIAKFTEEYLFNSEQSIERLARENPSLFRQVYDWIVDTIHKIGASAETKFLIDAQRKYEKAMRTTGTVNINAKSQLSIPYKANNDLKSKQLEIVKNANPMTDNYHVGIRSAADIKTFEEAMKDGESFFYGDFDITDAEKALKSGEITVYSSKPIEQGGFVSTSQNMARDYAGGGKVYSKKVKLDDVAWINGDEGQYAKVNAAKEIPDINSRYNEAVKNGDNATLRQMVEDAANEAGYNNKLYHQTGATFTEFNTQNASAGKYDSELPTGIFMKPDSNDIGFKGKTQMELYSKIQNPLRFRDRADAVRFWEREIPGYKEANDRIKAIDNKYQAKYNDADRADDIKYAALHKKLTSGEITREEFKAQLEEVVKNTQKVLDDWKNASNEARLEAKRLIDDYIASSGYDGMIVDNDAGSFGRSVKTYISFDPKNVKSADPVTYNKNLEPIPLSKRFDSNNPDIRYSMNSSKLAETDYTQRLKAASQNLSRTDNNGRTLTNEQQEYFKNSKVRDSEGRLMRVYHGTYDDFTTFNLDHTKNANDLGKGFYFTNKIDDAKNNYASSDGGDVQTKIEELAYELFQEKGYTEDDLYNNAYVEEYNKAYDEAEAYYNKGKTISTYLNLTNPLYASEYGHLYNSKGEEVMRASVEEYLRQGYDGIIDTSVKEKFPNQNLEEGTTHYVVFKPEQIKSIDNINPTNNPDIRYSINSSTLGETDYTQKLRTASQNLSGTDNDGRMLTKGQREYFKNSKVRDANGNLKVMYHGTGEAGFTVFDSKYSDDGRSFFFTDNIDVAKGYSASDNIFSRKHFESIDSLEKHIAQEMDENVEIRKNGKMFELWQDNDFVVRDESLDDLYWDYNEYMGFGGDSANYKVYLNLENPLVIDADKNNWDEIPVPWSDDLMTTRSIAEYANENGYDGVMINNVIDTGLYGQRFDTSNIAIAFDSNQIKNVDNANPTNNPDIRFSQNISSLPETDYTRRLRAASENLYGEKGNKYMQTVDNTGNQTTTLKDLGADIARPQQTIAEAKKKYGAYGGKKGDIPLRTDLGRVTQGANTVYNSPIADEEMMKAIKTGVEEGSYWTRKMSNKEALNAAAEKIKESGLDNETTSFLNLARDNREVKGEDIAMGYQLAKEHIAQGNYEAAQAVLSDVCQMESEAGRALQAMRLFNSLSPEGRVKSVMRSAEKIKKNTGVEVKVSDEMLEQLKNATAEELPAIKKQINNELWDQVPATFSEKLTAWRYLAMLGNPRTHIRNIVGNALYVPVVRMDNVIQTGLEKAMKNRLNKLGTNKTTAILTNSADDKALKKIGAERFKQLKDTLDSGNGKYNEELRPLESRVFKSKLLEGAKNLNSNALEKEDQLFMELNFKSAFAQYCKANGKKAADLTDDFIEEAANHAYDVALRSTYRDPSRLADVLGRFRKRTLTAKATDTLSEKALKTAGRVVMDSALPFTKTPINILKRGVSHSPLGLVKGMAEIATAKDGKQLVKAITQVSEGLTGTGIVALGMYMASIGMANGSLGEYDKEYKWKQLLGKQDYALNVDDYSITLDWAAPISMPFFVGVELGTKLLEEKGNVWDAIESLSQIYEPVLEMSMLSGIQSLFDFSNGDSKDLVSFMGNAAQNLTSQYIPTILGQTARTAVDERKIALSTAENKMQRNTEKYIDKLENKIPGLTNTNESYVDMFGRTEKKESAADYIEAGLENFLSPAYVQKANKNKVETELERMRQVLGAEGKEILPTDYSYNYDIRYNGEDIRMTEEQFTKYKKVRGKATYEGLEELFNSSKYKLMSTNEKKKAIQDVYDKAAEDAKKSTVISMGIATETEYKYSLLSENAKATVDAMKKKGIPAKTAVNAYETQKAYGSGTEKALALMKKGYNNQVIKGLDISNTQIEKARALQNAGISISKLTTAKKEADTNGNGNISKEEVINYVEARSFTPQEKYALLKALTPVKDKNNPYA